MGGYGFGPFDISKMALKTLLCPAFAEIAWVKAGQEGYHGVYLSPEARARR
jgi:hypothetical protein